MAKHKKGAMPPAFGRTEKGMSPSKGKMPMKEMPKRGKRGS